MDFKNLTDNEVNALAPHTFRYSVPIMQYHSKTNNSVGSGTLIKIDSRFFIATAGHNLTGVPDDCLFYVHSKEMVYEQLPFINRKPLANDSEQELDVGFIEIPSEMANTVTEKEFLPLNRIQPFVSAWPTRVFLTGYPAEMVPIDLAKNNRFNLSAIGYLTETKKEPAQSHDKSRDIDIDYEITSVFIENPKKSNIPKPHGLSGGGLWALPIKKSTELWKPSDTALIGIEKSWFEKSSCVRCTQIQHWLKLITYDYPELKDVIDDHLRSSGRTEMYL